MKSYSERTDATREKIKTYKNQAKARRKKIVLSTVISLCSCLLIAFNLVMFIPYTTYPNGYVNLSTYKNSEYYDVIKELSHIWYGDSVKPVYKNNFQRLTEMLSSGLAKSGAEASDDFLDYPASDETNNNAGASGGAGEPSSGEKYEETTDNQVAGVTEGDLLKRTNKYIYYLAFGQYAPPYLDLRIYPIAGMDTECIAEFRVTPPLHFLYYGNGEMYLNENGTTVTLVLPVYKTVQSNDNSKYISTQKKFTEVVNIDVSDHSDIKVTGNYLISGEYVSSRIVNGELLLVTNFSVPYNVDFNDEEQFIPSTGMDGDMKYISAKDIHCPAKPSYARYTVVCTVDAQTLEETGSEAFLSYSENVYVSENNIYLTNSYNSFNEQPFKKSQYTLDYEYRYVYYETKTEISRVEYGGELSYKGSVTVSGEVKNRFCMDEKDGVLRVVTSIGRYEYINFDKYNTGAYFINGASLYCIDIQTYKTVGKLENFAPEEDRVQSARFDGDKVYVCTAVVLTDPVFAIDISDYNNISFVDTGEIPGYSIALRKFYGDTLLGIGYDGNSWLERDLKIELYKEGENSVESVASFNYLDDGFEYNNMHFNEAYVGFSEEYKAYFIDAENGLIGLGIKIDAYYYNNNSRITQNRYILLKYDGQNLNLLLDIELNDETNYYFYNFTRAVYVDDMFYLFTQNGFTVKAI